MIPLLLGLVCVACIAFVAGCLYEVCRQAWVERRRSNVVPVHPRRKDIG